MTPNFFKCDEGGFVRSIACFRSVIIAPEFHRAGWVRFDGGRERVWWLIRANLGCSGRGQAAEQWNDVPDSFLRGIRPKSAARNLPSKRIELINRPSKTFAL
jgi:hypothetical protein